MFNKLLRNLPFNPSLVDQVSFYSKRLSREAGIRRAGFALIAMTMALQVFATLAPAQASLACDPSNNDIVQCGFKTKQEAVGYCQNNKAGFGTILLYHGLTCEKLTSAEEVTINTRDYNNRLRSVGRKAFGKTGETTQNIPGVGDVFWRPLSSWGNFSTRVLKTQTNDGQLVMVMFECGNLIKLDDFVLKQPTPDSDLSVVKVNTPTGEVRSGDVIKYTLAYSNKGGDAAFFSVHDILPNNVTLVSAESGSWAFENKAPHLSWNNGVPPFYAFGNTEKFGTPGFIFVTVRVNDRVPSGTTICNTAYVQDVQKGTSNIRKSSETQVCNNVVVTCPAGQLLDENGYSCKEVPPTPDAVCTSLIGVEKSDDKTHKNFIFTTTVGTVNGATIESYTYNFGDGTKPEVKPSKDNPHTIEHAFGTPKTYDVSVTVKTSVPDKPTLTCKTKAPVRPEDKSPEDSISKKAANITQNIKDANGTTAKPGDVIEYTLTSTNITDVDYKNYQLKPEDLGDVLEYANLDMNTLQGGTFDAEKKVLSWNGTFTLKANESVTKVFRVKVKDPIPSTPSPDTTNKSAGDLVMHNKYGNDIEIKLPGTPVKTVELVNSTLPKTGPGASLTIGFITMTIVGYFFARSRLMAKELVLVKDEYVETSGGI